MSQTETIARWVTALKWETLPPAVVEQVKRCLRDHLACVAGGARSKPGQIASGLSLRWAGPPEATIVGQSQKVAARHAAFANATMANALDYDDTYFGHPGSTTFPTALAAAEKWGADGRDFILAAVAGYELSARAMALMQPLIPRYRAMWDLGTLQSFGAVVAAARLAKLDEGSIATVLGIMAGTAPVPLPRKQRYPGEGRSMLKSAYGWAVDAALVAVDLAFAGFSGPGHALDDNLGFWEAKSSERLGVRDFADGLGERWAILNVEFKPFMACRFIHPVLQAVEEIMRREPISVDRVREVQVESFALLGDEHHYILQPVSETDAQFSVPYTVSAMLHGGKLTPESYAEHTLKDPAVLDLAKRVHVNLDTDYESAYPARLGARITIQRHDGSYDTAAVEHPKGSANQPLSDNDLWQKYYLLVDPLLGTERAAALADKIDSLENLKSLGELTRWFNPDADLQQLVLA